MKFSELLSVATLVLLPSISLAQEPAGRVTLRVGMLAPEGSSLVHEARGGFQEAEEKSRGRLKFLLYTGGVLGGETDMIRKLRIGQVDAVALSGGMGTVVPDTAVLSLPFLFRSYEEVDYAREGLFEAFAGAFEKQGMVLLLWFDVGGFTQFFSSQPVASVSDMASRKVWMWSEIPLANEFLRVFPMKGVPIDVTNLVQAFQTGMVDSAFINPLFLLVFQLQKNVRYMTRLNFSYVPVALVGSKKMWDELPADLQGILTDTLRKYTPKMVARARADDDTALRGLIRSGIQVVMPSPEAMAEFESLGRKGWNDYAGKLYPKSILEAVLHRLKDFRSRKL
ncbi:MAG: TRAP transporter substrate-binding protein DctP [Nitrospirae bacterium]|nr:TRAP transporter substrate-binding protein DctP [Nitrospirota bacterium]